jgi:molybdopterin-containing oxidoreductase family iron-sulfur binding subunit
MAGCPYGSRSFNWVDPRPYITKRNPNFPTRTIGVVEKCTFCPERLAKGQLPACVEASKGGMIFGNLADSHSEIRKVLSTHFTLRRKPTLGTMPSVFYIIGGEDYAG